MVYVFYFGRLIHWLNEYSLAGDLTFVMTHTKIYSSERILLAVWQGLE